MSARLIMSVRALACIVLSVFVGCEPPGSGKTTAPKKTASRKPARPRPRAKPRSTPPARANSKDGSRGAQNLADISTPDDKTGSPQAKKDKGGITVQRLDRRTLGNLLENSGGPVFQGRFPPVDEEKVKAAGLRKLAGKHLTLYTDLPSAADIDELPKVFDLAVPQWTAYFGLEAAKTGKAHLIGCLIKDRERFTRAGLLTKDVPEFENGYNLANRFWVEQQPSIYYTRHLILHEGTHGFMQMFLNGSGPPWYSEGMAELFGAHRWADGKLKLGYMPRNKEETPYWGRLKVIKRDLKANKARTIRAVFAYTSIAHRDVEAYGWCWAATTFFDKHPHFQKVFRALGKHANEASTRFSLVFLEQLRQLNSNPQRTSFDVLQQWQWYIFNLDYGYDVAREAIDQTAPQALPVSGKEVKIRADRGWQSTGIQIQPGEYTFKAEGRYQIGDQPKVWWCEPGGVTIRYHRGHPLGMLVAAVAPENLESGTSPLVSPRPIGLGRTVRFDKPGTLFFRINDSPSELADNKGSLSVRVQSVGNRSTTN